MNVEFKGNKLIITMDVNTDRPLSKSGKSLAVAGTSGNVKTGVIDPKTNKELVVGINAYVKAAD